MKSFALSFARKVSNLIHSRHFRAFAHNGIVVSHTAYLAVLVIDLHTVVIVAECAAIFCVVCDTIAHNAD